MCVNVIVCAMVDGRGVCVCCCVFRLRLYVRVLVVVCVCVCLCFGRVCVFACVRDCRCGECV